MPPTAVLRLIQPEQANTPHDFQRLSAGLAQGEEVDFESAIHCRFCLAHNARIRIIICVSNHQNGLPEWVCHERILDSTWRISLLKSAVKLESAKTFSGCTSKT